MIDANGDGWAAFVAYRNAQKFWCHHPCDCAATLEINRRRESFLTRLHKNSYNRLSVVTIPLISAGIITLDALRRYARIMIENNATRCHNVVRVIRISEQKNGIQNVDWKFVRSFCTRWWRSVAKSERVTLKRNLIFESHISGASIPHVHLHDFRGQDVIDSREPMLPDKLLFFFF